MTPRSRRTARSPRPSRRRSRSALVAVLVLRGAAARTRPARRARGARAGDALVYVHLSTDRTARRTARRAARRGASRARRGCATGSRPRRARRPSTLERDVRPWLGDEAALRRRRRPARPLAAGAVADRAGAERARRAIGNRRPGAPTTAASRLERRRDRRWRSSRRLARPRPERGGARGDRPRRGRGRALADATPTRRAAAGRPPAASLDAYASRDGVRGCSPPRGGLLGAVGALLDRPGSRRPAPRSTADDGARCGSHARSPAAAAGTPRSSRCCSSACRRAPWPTSACASASRLRRSSARSAADRRSRGCASSSPTTRASTSTASCSRRSRARSRSPSRRPRPGGPRRRPVVTLRPGRRAGDRGARSRGCRTPLATLLAQPGSAPGVPSAADRRLDAFALRVTPELAPTYAVSPTA